MMDEIVCDTKIDDICWVSKTPVILSMFFLRGCVCVCARARFSAHVMFICVFCC